jgi:hypothetical protein
VLGGHFTHLREDAGLKETLGHEIPSPEAARQFLYQHADEKIEEAKQRRGRSKSRLFRMRATG